MLLLKVANIYFERYMQYFEDNIKNSNYVETIRTNFQASQVMIV